MIAGLSVYAWVCIFGVVLVMTMAIAAVLQEILDPEPATQLVTDMWEINARADAMDER